MIAWCGDRTVQYLAAANPDVVMVHLDQVDGAGHSSGYSPTVPAYLRAIEVVDGIVGDLLVAVNARSNIEQEDWLVIVTTDHGGNGTSHGGQSEGGTHYLYDRFRCRNKATRYLSRARARCRPSNGNAAPRIACRRHLGMGK